MDAGFDHVTIVVTDLDEAKEFFGILGFEERLSVVASGETVSKYMGIPDWEADHVTLASKEAGTHQEVQLLRFHKPPVQVDQEVGNLSRTGFNHICFRVADMDATVARMRSHGVGTKNEVMDFHDRRLVFLNGPAGVTIELAEWIVPPTD